MVLVGVLHTSSTSSTSGTSRCTSSTSGTSWCTSITCIVISKLCDKRGQRVKAFLSVRVFQCLSACSCVCMRV